MRFVSRDLRAAVTDHRRSGGNGPVRPERDCLGLEQPRGISPSHRTATCTWSRPEPAGRGLVAQVHRTVRNIRSGCSASARPGASPSSTRTARTGGSSPACRRSSNDADPVEALGPSDIAFTGNQKFVLEHRRWRQRHVPRRLRRTTAGCSATLVTGKLKQGGWSLFADVLANEAVANPDGTDIDSNPVGILRQGEGYLVADAGGQCRRARVAQGDVHDGRDPATRQRAGATVPRAATGHADPDRRGTDLGGPRPGRCVLRQHSSPGSRSRRATPTSGGWSRARRPRCTRRGSRTSPTSPSPTTGRCTPCRSPSRGC